MQAIHNIGEYKESIKCRFCGSKNLVKILDLGLMPLAGAFMKKKEIEEEKYYPLGLCFCCNCTLIQVKNVVSADTLFKENYFFYSSAIGTLVEHFKEYAKDIYERFLNKIISPSVLEIGCNDGVLIDPLSQYGVKCIGVDPATNVVNTIKNKNLHIVNDYFSEKLASDIVKQFGQVNAVLSSFSMAHIDDMNDIMKGIQIILKDDGILVFEIYYLGTLIKELQYDMIYHEHINYYSLISLTKFLQKYNFKIFDVRMTPGVRAGSARFYACNKNNNIEKTSSIKKMQDEELLNEYDRLDTFKNYAKKIQDTKNELIALLKEIKKDGKKIIGYGASGRGTIIMNYCGIDHRYIDYVIDDAPAKHGHYTPGTHLKIYPWNINFDDTMPEYILLFAWSFADEIVKKRKEFMENGGKFIVPLPEVKLLSL